MKGVSNDERREGKFRMGNSKFYIHVRRDLPMVERDAFANYQTHRMVLPFWDSGNKLVTGEVGMTARISGVRAVNL